MERRPSMYFLRSVITSGSLNDNCLDTPLRDDGRAIGKEYVRGKLEKHGGQETI